MESSSHQGPVSRSLRCAVTGVDMDGKVAYVLDLPRAQERVAQTRSDLALLERMIEQLGGLAQREPAVGRARRWAVVSPAVANAFQGGIADGLFVAWEDVRKRQTAAAMSRVRRHPLYGATARGLDDAALAKRLAFGRALFRALRFAQRVDLDVKLAVEWGAAFALFGSPLDSAVGRFLDAVDQGKADELGIDPALLPVVRGHLHGSKG